MATPITGYNRVVGVEEESTEGTYVAPSAATSYIQVLQDGIELNPVIERLERNLVNSSIGAISPRMGRRSATAAIPVELRASGTEGGDVDFGSLLKGALGATRAISTTTTTKNSGNTGSVLQIDDADISKFNLGDIVCVKESGGHHVAVVTAKATGTGVATITISPSKASGSFSNSVVVSKSKMYYTATSGHPALSISSYLGNTYRQKAVGMKVTEMSLEMATGGLSTINFALDGIDYDEDDGAAPHTPSYDSGLPPVILSASLYKDGTAVEVKGMNLSLVNELVFLEPTSSTTGRSKSIVRNRTVTGSITPYKDDGATTRFDEYQAGTEFSLFIRAYNPSSTSGESTMGSIVGIYLPKVIFTEFKAADQDGLIVEELGFQAVRGTDGATEEMYLGLI